MNWQHVPQTWSSSRIEPPKLLNLAIFLLYRCVSTVASVVNLVRPYCRKLITMSAHFCLQHFGRDIERRAVRLRRIALQI